MKKSISLFLGALALGVAALFVIHHARADDLAKVHKGSKVLLDNDHVRVVETTIEPGAKTGMHSHPNHVVYAIKGGSTKFTLADGKTTEMEIAEGKAIWAEATTHDAENTGKAEIKVLVIELKEKK